MSDPRKIAATLQRAAEAFQRTPGRMGRFLQLSDADEVLVAGDLHGHLGNFKRLLEIAQLAEHPRRHLVVQELIHGPFHYADGGDSSHRLLDLVAALKCQFPERVHMLLGNHELSQWTDRAIMKAEANLNQLFRWGLETAYGAHADLVYAAYGRMFAAIPVALRTPNRVFLSHSLPGSNRLDTWDIEALKREEFTESDGKLGGSIHAIVWGKDTAEETAVRFLARVDADWLVTGHIPCDSGYATPNSRQLILDCKDEAGCFCLFDTQRPQSLATLLDGVQPLR